MSGCRIVPKDDKPQTTTPSNVHPTPETTDSYMTEMEMATITDSIDFDRFLKSTTMESVPSKRNTEELIENEHQPAASEIENLDNETDVFNVSTATGGGVQFKHDIMPFENELENSTEYRTDVEEMFQKLDNRRPIRESESSQREPLIPLLRRSRRESLLVRCHNGGSFSTARERWWYIAVANCGSEKGLDITYRFKMTNGNPGDFWSEHFSADEMRRKKFTLKCWC